MRILRIGLKNLNSLRGEHSVDLENGPLADAGIFAITGPTGAGKSTLLDAITLALYGRAARYGKKPNPEDMMSRHTGVCSAQVEFEVPEGRFRAEWQLSRARKDPKGNLQQAKRFLYDAMGTPMTQKMREVDVELEKLIGLDYERFLRSAMLAQGDFARFLKANANERSELLESLTGTQIYSHLSALCHEETVRKEESLRSREQMLGEIKLLEPDVQEALKRQMRQLKSALEVDKKAAEVIRAEVERGRQLSQCLEKDRKLRELSVALEADARRRAAEFEKLNQHRKAEVFLPALAKIEQRQQTEREAGEAAETASGAVAQTRRDLRAVLESARRLAESSVVVAEADCKKLECGLKESVAEGEAIAHWLADHLGDTALASELPGIATGLTKLANHRMALVGLDKRDGEKAEEISASTVERDALSKQRAKIEEQRKEQWEALTLQQDRLKSVLGGRELGQVQEAFERLKVQLEALGRRTKLQARASELSEKAARLQPERAHARELLVARKEMVEALQAALHAAQVIASLDDHRRDLKPGDPCPLCGALEHPFVDPENRPRSADQAERLQKAREELRAVEKSERELGIEWTKTHEALRGTREELTEIEKSLLSAPEHAQEAAAGLKEQIAQAQEAEKQLVRAEKALIECRGEFGKVNEQVTACEQRLQRLGTERQRIAEEIAEIKVETAAQSEALGQKLAPFAVTLAVNGEAELCRTLEERAREFVARQRLQVEVAARITEVRVALEKCEERAKLSREDADNWFSAVQQEGLQEVGLPTAVPELADIAESVKEYRARRAAAEATAKERNEAKGRAAAALREEEALLVELLKGSEFVDVCGLKGALLAADIVKTIDAAAGDLAKRRAELSGQQRQIDDTLQELRSSMAPQGELLDTKEAEAKTLNERIEEAATRLAKVKVDLEHDDYNRKMHAERVKSMEDERRHFAIWQRLRDLIGSHDGRKFRTFAQGLSLDLLLRHANGHLAKLTDRYQLQRVEGEALQLEIVDLHQANVLRPMESLSGGESFLASLALALGLSDLAGRNVRIDSLFIDEGFGSLDHDTLDVAVAALEGLRSGSKTVGVISHVDLLKERISAQLRVQPGPDGVSTIEAVAG
ncbi:MAG: AAA family ATPase [Verrucomicrobia bacterium]|nr:AAA family ATPase [Verrucomicrobiota bacterium]